jgi:hypothetical protein
MAYVFYVLNPKTLDDTLDNHSVVSNEWKVGKTIDAKSG